MLIYCLIFYSAHPHHSYRCEAFEQHSRSIHIHSRKRAIILTAVKPSNNLERQMARQKDGMWLTRKKRNSRGRSQEEEKQQQKVGHRPATPYPDKVDSKEEERRDPCGTCGTSAMEEEEWWCACYGQIEQLAKELEMP
jgi:hypothetical protein